ncbi:MAG: PDZ domain-containing protein [Planctomycetes bacterium]|nr:PDZ domain-containing protein [Planctomycetota bacterium]
MRCASWFEAFAGHPDRIRFRAVLVLAVCALLAPVARGEEEEPLPEAGEALTDLTPVRQLSKLILETIREAPLDEVWESVGRLVRLGRLPDSPVAELLEQALKDPDDKVRLASARALCQLGQTDPAGTTLLTLLKDSKDAQVRRYAATAVGLTPKLYGHKGATEALVAALEAETAAENKIAAARALWRISGRSEAKALLAQTMRTSREKAARDESALALAEMGFLVAKDEWEGRPEEALLRDVFERLEDLKDEPTERGQRADNLFNTLEADAQRLMHPEMQDGFRLMREVLGWVQKAYPDEAKGNDLEALFEHASKGLIDALDPFSEYLDREEVKATQEMLRQDYGGIGAYVGVRDNKFTIISPIYGSPADRAGLRSMDVILEVDGHDTSEMIDDGGMNTVITRLKGEPGSPVKLKYFRKGFMKALEVTIIRDSIKVQSVYHALLPGHIGYIRLTRFGERSTEEMKEALAELVDKQKVKGMIFDLRDNPGGLLRTGVEIADQFLSGGKLIVYSQGRDEFAPYKPFYSHGGADREEFPMVCLVNNGSASASEIVAGCLQHYKRAQLIGEKTYGKGSVQQIIPLRATRRETQLRLTIAKYYLPSGQCIHEKGIEPDGAQAQSEYDDWTWRQIYELREARTFENFVRDRWDANKASFLLLSEWDGRETAKYPDFDAFYEGLKDRRIARDDVRSEIRRVVRRMAQDEMRQEFACDLQEDQVLQRGVFELSKKMPVDLAGIVQYRELAEKFKNAAKPDPALSALAPQEATPAEKVLEPAK